MDDNAEEIKADENDAKSQKKIETAVKFLQNPRVKETPLSQRKAFLVKKGLTEDEIQKALELAQTADSSTHVIPRNLAQSQAVFPVDPSSDSLQNAMRNPRISAQPPPFTLRLRDFFWVALVGGSFGYLLAHLVKTYLLPYILNQKDESDGKIDQLQTSVSELKENLSQTVNGIQDTLDSVQKMLQDQQQKVQTMSLNLSTSQASLSQSMTESYSLTEIKSELTSLKGLLLNRRQFPSPVVQSSPFPSIPAWQRNDTESNEDPDVKNGNLMGTIAETEKETSEYNGNDTETSSGTLELQSGEASGLLTTQTTADSEKTHPDQCDSSFSTMSSEVGSPNLSLSEDNGLKESLSESYVKLPN